MCMTYSVVGAVLGSVVGVVLLGALLLVIIVVKRLHSHQEMTLM